MKTAEPDITDQTPGLHYESDMFFFTFGSVNE